MSRHYDAIVIGSGPEISSLGPNERELTEARIPHEVGRAMFKSIARAQITVHTGQAIMAHKGDANTVKYFVETTFNYPTMAEAYRVAALNGLNRL